MRFLSKNLECPVCNKIVVFCVNVDEVKHKGKEVKFTMTHASDDDHILDLIGANNVSR